MMGPATKTTMAMPRESPRGSCRGSILDSKRVQVKRKTNQNTTRGQKYKEKKKKKKNKKTGTILILGKVKILREAEVPGEVRPDDLRHQRRRGSRVRNQDQEGAGGLSHPAGRRLVALASAAEKQAKAAETAGGGPGRCVSGQTGSRPARRCSASAGAAEFAFPAASRTYSEAAGPPRNPSHPGGDQRCCPGSRWREEKFQPGDRASWWGARQQGGDSGWPASGQKKEPRRCGCWGLLGLRCVRTLFLGTRTAVGGCS